MDKNDNKHTKIFKTKSLKKKTKKNIEAGKTQVVSTKDINSKASSKNAKKKRRKKIIKICFFVFLALFIICAGLVIGVITGVIDKTDSLNLEELKLYKETSFVYDKNGNQIGAFYDSENRVTVEYKDIPQTVVDAVVSIEDERFFKHHGVDLKRTTGAIFTYITHGGKSSFGGSTITQQLVKNIKNDKEATWTRKIREWYRAIALENKLSKEEIFEAYVNQIYMGDGCYGFEVASRNYFGKPLSEVNLAESAVLAAIIQSPESTNPYKSEEAKNKLLERKNLVLKQMLKLKKISEDEYNEALNYEIVFKKEDDSTKQSSNGAQYTYYVEAVREAVINDLMETLGVERGIAITKLYGNGYKIYTPFDPDVQSAIDSAYNNSKLFYTDSKGDFMQSAMVVIEQSTGCVLGLIGGADEKTSDLVVNRATQLTRQPGSCMKPLGAYGPAFELGLSSPGAGLDDCELTEGNWHPGNYYGYFNGYVTARNAIAKSMNLPAARANLKVDIDYAYNFAKNTGLKRLVAADKAPAALSLGGLTNGVTVMDMANAYATIANGGVYIEPRLYTKITDSKDEDVIVNNINSKRVMKESTAFMLTSCLQEVVKTGTAAGYVRLSNMDVAGKTGNTNKDFDQWFCGFTPYYTIACWNGYDKVGGKAGQKSIGYRKIGSYPYTSVSLFNTVVNSISKGKQSKHFEVPNSVTKVELCKVSGLVPTDACKNDPRGSQVGSDYVAKDSIPTETCNIHKTIKICNETGKIATEYCPNTSEKSFITRDYTPNVKPADWAYMAPTETCNVHTSKNSSSSNDEEESNGIHIYKNTNTNNNKTTTKKN